MSHLVQIETDIADHEFLQVPDVAIIFRSDVMYDKVVVMLEVLLEDLRIEFRSAMVCYTSRESMVSIKLLFLTRQVDAPSLD